jgi:hypothetical protein
LWWLSLLWLKLLWLLLFVFVFVFLFVVNRERGRGVPAINECSSKDKSSNSSNTCSIMSHNKQCSLLGVLFSREGIYYGAPSKKRTSLGAKLLLFIFEFYSIALFLFYFYFYFYFYLFLFLFKLILKFQLHTMAVFHAVLAAMVLVCCCGFPLSFKMNAGFSDDQVFLIFRHFPLH